MKTKEYRLYKLRKGKWTLSDWADKECTDCKGSGLADLPSSKGYRCFQHCPTCKPMEHIRSMRTEIDKIIAKFKNERGF